MTTATEAFRYGRVKVRFFDVEVPTVVVGRGVYFPVRALAKVLGMAPQMQIAKLRNLEQSDSRFKDCLREIPIPTIKGLREATCLRKQQVTLYLATIDPARAPITAKGTIERFQSELFAAADRFLFGDDSELAYDPATKRASSVSGTLSVGDCPYCGGALCLVMDADGGHLAPVGQEDD